MELLNALTTNYYCAFQGVEGWGLDVANKATSALSLSSGREFVVVLDRHIVALRGLSERVDKVAVAVISFITVIPFTLGLFYKVVHYYRHREEYSRLIQQSNDTVITTDALLRKPQEYNETSFWDRCLAEVNDYREILREFDRLIPDWAMDESTTVARRGLQKILRAIDREEFPYINPLEQSNFANQLKSELRVITAIMRDPNTSNRTEKAALLESLGTSGHECEPTWARETQAIWLNLGFQENTCDKILRRLQSAKEEDLRRSLAEELWRVFKKRVVQHHWHQVAKKQLHGVVAFENSDLRFDVMGSFLTSEEGRYFSRERVLGVFLEKFTPERIVQVIRSQLTEHYDAVVDRALYISIMQKCYLKGSLHIYLDPPKGASMPSAPVYGFYGKKLTTLDGIGQAFAPEDCFHTSHIRCGDTLPDGAIPIVLDPNEDGYRFDLAGLVEDVVDNSEKMQESARNVVARSLAKDMELIC